MKLWAATPDQVLNIDCRQASKQITLQIQEGVRTLLRKRGVVVALSGGIDSSVVGALCVEALGPNNVLGLLLPEKESASETLSLSRLIGEHLGIDLIERDITDVLECTGCYKYRNEAIQRAIPEFTSDYKCKIVLPNILDKPRYNIFSLVVRSPEGEMIKARPSVQDYLQIVAASNFKQRIRKLFEYYHADRLNYAVTGTPNRLEYDQGFFVKYGDGAADLKPIAHLYKTQVYQLARYLGLPDEIIERPPTTDTYSMPQSQEEFYFSIPYEKMDLCLYGKNYDIQAVEMAALVNLKPEQVEWIYQDIEAKRKATRYQHMAPILIEPVVK